MIARELRNRGPEIEIEFADGSGVTPGKTELHRDILLRAEELMRRKARRNAGMRVEMKRASVAFHYRNADPFLAEVAWSWLVDALDARSARYVAASGTVTKILSTGFGELARQGDGAELELRASWTPLDEVAAPHVEGWSELLCMLAGLPPSSEGVTALPRRRRRRG